MVCVDVSSIVVVCRTVDTSSASFRCTGENFASGVEVGITSSVERFIGPAGTLIVSSGGRRRRIACVIL